MISKGLSAILSYAVKEARRRRHEYVCVEHILYAILRDSNGIELIEVCGGNVENIQNELEKFFNEKLERISEDREYVLQQTMQFQRVIQRAVNHVRSVEKDAVYVGDILASMLEEKNSHAAYFMAAEGITRLDVLNVISHGSRSETFKEGPDTGIMPGRKEKKRSADPLEAFTLDLVERAAAGKLDPLIGRVTEMERTIHVLGRRRKNNPVFVGEPGCRQNRHGRRPCQQNRRGDVPNF
jgi:ATP-dependent Clp protease ATP-binding subunit ClpA